MAQHPSEMGGVPGSPFPSDPSALWASFAPPLRAFLARRVPPGVDADDLLQETFLIMITKAETIRNLDAWLLATTGDTGHICGTCRMGADGDPMAVTDNQGRVRGVAGLRVVDASLFPAVPCANTNFPTIMTAEKIADAILDGH